MSAAGRRALATHLTYTQRVMGEVFGSDEKPTDIWDQHEAILGAMCAGDGDRAEALAREHISLASAVLVARLGAGVVSNVSVRSTSVLGRRSVQGSGCKPVYGGNLSLLQHELHLLFVHLLLIEQSLKV